MRPLGFVFIRADENINPGRRTGHELTMAISKDKLAERFTWERI